MALAMGSREVDMCLREDGVIRSLGRRKVAKSRRVGEPVAQMPRMAAIDDTAQAVRLCPGIPDDGGNVSEPCPSAAICGKCVGAQVESAAAHQNIGGMRAAHFTHRKGVTQVSHDRAASI